jgi:hypothetical protein
VQFVPIVGLALLVAACASSPREKKPATADVRQPDGSVAPDSIRSHCEREKLECRRNVRIVLRRNDGTTYDKTFDWFTPVLQGDPPSVYLLPGDALQLELEPDGNRLTPRRIVSNPSMPEKTISLRFSQDAKGRMIFAATNPFSNAVKFDLFMLLLDDPQDRPRATSSCPIQSRLTNFELWQQPIFTLVATNFRFVEGDAARKCDAPPEIRQLTAPDR